MVFGIHSLSGTKCNDRSLPLQTLPPNRVLKDCISLCFSQKKKAFVSVKFTSSKVTRSSSTHLLILYKGKDKTYSCLLANNFIKNVIYFFNTQYHKLKKNRVSTNHVSCH